MPKAMLNFEKHPPVFMPGESQGSQTAQKLYLDLMKQCLTYFVWGEGIQPLKSYDIRSPFWRRLFPLMMRRLSRTNILLMREAKFDPVVRTEGLDHPVLAHTMIGLKRLDNIQDCIEDVLRNGVPGDLIETGVWRGGATIFMRAALKAYEVTDRKVWVADSFAGLPHPDPERYPADKGDNHHAMTHLAVSLEQVKANFAKYGLLDDQVCFLKGWFKDTLPTAPIQKLAVMRLDGDMYESTMDALTSLYPKLSIGGYVIIDDYGYIESCRQAVHDFRRANQIEDEIKQVDWSGVYWQRSQ
jgi:O-methyltransferase